MGISIHFTDKEAEAPKIKSWSRWWNRIEIRPNVSLLPALYFYMRPYELQISVITTPHWGLCDESHHPRWPTFGLQRTSTSRASALGSCFGASKSSMPSNNYFKRNKDGENLWKQKVGSWGFVQGNTEYENCTWRSPTEIKSQRKVVLWVLSCCISV